VRDLDLGSLLGEHLSVHAVPGAAVGVLHGTAVTAAYRGVADAATGTPVTAGTRFAVGSLAKSTVATAIVRLADAGRLSLDDPVSAHVPELRRADWAQRATVRDLLANRSRLPLRAQLEFAAVPGEDDDVLSRLAAELAKAAPRARFWSYTNAGWCLLGRAIETLTGRSWEEAMRAELFAPLGMEQTTFLNRRVAGPRAVGHRLTPRGPVPAEPWTPRSHGPAGSTLLSTLGDLLRFAGWHLEDPSLAVMRSPQAEVRIHGWLDGWCLGWARFDWDGGPVWGWDGLISGSRAILRLVPQQRGAVVLLTNGSTGRALYRSLFPILMRAWFGIGMPALRLTPSPGAAGDLARFAGLYAWPDRRWEVTPSGTHLVMDGDGGAIEAWPLDDRTFVVDAADPDTPTVTFGGFDPGGRPAVLYQMLWGLPRQAASQAIAAQSFTPFGVSP
jgi:CubicO group peptidase (beta-lactamase class C family)